MTSRRREPASSRIVWVSQSRSKTTSARSGLASTRWERAGGRSAAASRGARDRCPRPPSASARPRRARAGCRAPPAPRGRRADRLVIVPSGESVARRCSLASTSPSTVTSPATGSPGPYGGNVVERVADDLAARERRQVDRPLGLAEHGAQIASAPSTTPARSSRARTLTSVIELPGRMSWNWLSSSVCQSAASSSRGYGASLASADSSSASRSAPSARRLSRLTCGLRGVGAAVQLEVELADDRPQIRRVRLQQVEELDGRADRRLRQPGDVARPAQALEHLVGRPAAAVAVPEDHQRVARAAVVLVGRALAVQLGDGRLGVVGVRGREVGQDLRAVQALPGERVVLGLR